MISKQAKVLSDSQVKAIHSFLSTSRNGKRDVVIFLLSVKAGLRAKEIASLTWKMILNSDGTLGDTINLEDSASKGKSGRVIALNKVLKGALEELLVSERQRKRFDQETAFVVRTERSNSTTPQVVVNLFQSWYSRLGLVGCSSHSGRRTMITNAAKKVSVAGGSLRDVQLLAGHKSLQTTQRYIEYDTDAQRRLVNLI
jgi:integrase/recombinase XerD